jgi:hypothetical protein
VILVALVSIKKRVGVFYTWMELCGTVISNRAPVS